MQWLMCAVIVAASACVPVTEPQPSRLPAATSPQPTLTVLALADGVFAVKSSGRIVAINGAILIVRVDRVNFGNQRGLDDAVIGLRTDSTTSVQRVEVRSDPSATALDLRGIAVGESITFMFEPSSFQRESGTYLARVIGRHL